MEKCTYADICVVGGGLSGMLAAIAAARMGAKVALIHDRPVLGGNCSSEIRMWALGCHGRNNRETGILEEILLENMYRNPTRNFSIWDSILYEKVRFEPNITLFLNCSANGVEMDGARIRSVRAWQLTTYTWHTVYAKIFLDCSGDSVLAPLTGAEFKVGREAASEYGEDIEPERADAYTMGMTCMIQARETSKPVAFIPPAWAYQYDEDDFPFRGHDIHEPLMNYWWMELGGTRDSIHDTEEIRDELLKVAFGVWDHIKNRGDHGAENWELDWVGFLPGKRESRRYVGDHVLTQGDVRSEGRFDDLVAYGGWTMDDHHPGGWDYKGKPNDFHPAPTPYGIAYRCLYSRNIDNLMFAGRNISATHAALSSSRVMATCAVLGQACGTAAAIAVKNGITPRGVYQLHIKELQQTLMDADCYLPFTRREIPELTKKAKLTVSSGNPESLRDGFDRPIGEEDHAWVGDTNGFVTYSFAGETHVRGLRIVLDSDLNRESCDGHEVLRRYPMLCNKFFEMQPFGFPKTMLKKFSVVGVFKDGSEKELHRIDNNIQRLIRLPVDARLTAIKMIPLETWGAKRVRIFSFDIH